MRVPAELYRSDNTLLRGRGNGFVATFLPGPIPSLVNRLRALSPGKNFFTDSL